MAASRGTGAAASASDGSVNALGLSRADMLRVSAAIFEPPASSARPPVDGATAALVMEAMAAPEPTLLGVRLRPLFALVRAARRARSAAVFSVLCPDTSGASRKAWHCLLGNVLGLYTKRAFLNVRHCPEHTAEWYRRVGAAGVCCCGCLCRQLRCPKIRTDQRGCAVRFSLHPLELSTTNLRSRDAAVVRAGGADGGDGSGGGGSTTSAGPEDHVPAPGDVGVSHALELSPFAGVDPYSDGAAAAAGFCSDPDQVDRTCTNEEAKRARAAARAAARGLPAPPASTAADGAGARYASAGAGAAASTGSGSGSGGGASSAGRGAARGIDDDTWLKSADAAAVREWKSQFRDRPDAFFNELTLAETWEAIGWGVPRDSDRDGRRKASKGK